jgi:hypothetical protein
MKNIRIDPEGNQRCWNCGGQNCFTLKRTFRSKVLFGVGALLADKKLKCQLCGEYNQTGSAEPFEGPDNQRLAQTAPGSASTASATLHPRSVEDLARDGKTTDAIKMLREQTPTLTFADAAVVARALKNGLDPQKALASGRKERKFALFFGLVAAVLLGYCVYDFLYNEGRHVYYLIDSVF